MGASRMPGKERGSRADLAWLMVYLMGAWVASGVMGTALVSFLPRITGGFAAGFLGGFLTLIFLLALGAAADG